MSTEQKNKAEETFKKHLHFLSNGNITEWVNLFTEDGILEFPYATKGYPKKIQGRDNLMEYMVNFPNHFKVKFINLHFHPTGNPNLVIAEFNSDGIAIETGNPYLQKYISVVTTNNDGEILKYVDFWNPIIAMEALGVKINDEEFANQFIN